MFVFLVIDIIPVWSGYRRDDAHTKGEHLFYNVKYAPIPSILNHPISQKYIKFTSHTLKPSDRANPSQFKEMIISLN
jgi:hypothetical protein